MEGNSSTDLGTSIMNVAQTIIKMISDLAALAGTEALLAGKSIITILQLVVVIKVLSIITWLALCSAAISELIYLGYTWAFSFLMLALLNFSLLLLVFIMQIRLKRNLTFPATRRQLRQSFTRDIGDEQIKT